MRTHIVGAENRYYKSEEDAEAGLRPAAVYQVAARINPDNKTWMVYRTMTIAPSEKSETLHEFASLREAYNLVRGNEEKPLQMKGLPVVRQSCPPENHNEYWRNMPQPC